MGVVIYVGERAMSMDKIFQSFWLQYTCPMIDIRDIPPDVFLASNAPPSEVILAILAGRDDKREVIQQILRKLRILTAGDVAFFSEKIKHLELIAQLRGVNLQEQLIKEEETMPITIDIRKDLRYQQGVISGKEEGVLETQRENALKMLEKGISLSIVEEITGLSATEIKAMQN